MRMSRRERPGQLGRLAAGERPDKPFTGFKLARPVLSADGSGAAFTGLTLGASQVYGVVAEATCVWNQRHVPPRRWCGCGFYCLHALPDARALGCATQNRSAVLLEVTAAGQYIRYELGLQYSRQRVRAIRDSWCACGRPGTSLADAGTGIVGWRHQTPICLYCATERPGRPVLPMDTFADMLGGQAAGQVLVEPAPALAGSADTRSPDAEPRIAESPMAVLTAEIALLHARLDELQSRFERG